MEEVVDVGMWSALVLVGWALTTPCEIVDSTLSQPSNFWHVFNIWEIKHAALNFAVSNLSHDIFVFFKAQSFLVLHENHDSPLQLSMSSGRVAWMLLLDMDPYITPSNKYYRTRCSVFAGWKQLMCCCLRTYVLLFKNQGIIYILKQKACVKLSTN